MTIKNITANVEVVTNKSNNTKNYAVIQKPVSISLNETETTQIIKTEDLKK